ncbi:MAG: hypothetical protein AAF611_03650 [Bacteroidota bacterium]
MKDRVRTVALVASGFLQLYLSEFIPIGGGGIGLILLVTIPVLIGLGVVSGAIYFALISKLNNQLFKSSFFYGMMMVILFLTFMYYPYR